MLGGCLGSLWACACLSSCPTLAVCVGPAGTDTEGGKRPESHSEGGGGHEGPTSPGNSQQHLKPLARPQLRSGRWSMQMSSCK